LVLTGMPLPKPLLAAGSLKVSPWTAITVSFVEESVLMAAVTVNPLAAAAATEAAAIQWRVVSWRISFLMGVVRTGSQEKFGASTLVDCPARSGTAESAREPCTSSAPVPSLFRQSLMTQELTRSHER
jgi:hypothetical protein